MLFTVVVSKEDNWYIAKCIENNVASQGKTVEEAIANLKEAIELYYEGEEIQKPQMPLLITTIEVAV